MVYKQGVNRVANDEVFPYPLKCWYDDEYIYVQVLRIPKPEECKLSPYIMKGVRDGVYDVNNYDLNSTSSKDRYLGYTSNYGRKLTVCLETKLNKLHKRNRDILKGKNGHPTRGVRFKLSLEAPKYGVRYQDNYIYTFPIDKKYYANSVALYHESYGREYFMTIRATIRFLRYGGTPGQIGSNPIFERTGIYSNTIIIHK